MTIRFVALLIIGTCTLYAVASAANVSVIHIGQRDTVYYGDVIDLRGVTGWADTLAWWAANHDPSQDPPDQFINITKYERFNITTGLKAGMWYQWYGTNERSPVAVFWVVPKARPASAAITPAPTPTEAPAPPPRMQPAPIADYVVARYDDFTTDIGTTAQVWIIGPSLGTLGVVESRITMHPVTMYAGDYTLIYQYPDANNIFEVFRNEDYIESVWKGVGSVWLEPLSSEVLYDRLTGFFNDTAHFHGQITEKRMIVGEQSVGIGTVDQSNSGIFVSGLTNLRKGENLTLGFAGRTFQATAEGDDPGAMRVWRTMLDVDLNKTAPGEHFISATPPHGERVTAPVYISEQFKPFDVPATTIKYVNNSPFIPTPTPLIIEKQIQVTVIQTVTVPVTPSDAALLYAAQVAQNQSRVIFETNLAIVGVMIVLLYLGIRLTRYLTGVVRRARAA